MDDHSQTLFVCKSCQEASLHKNEMAEHLKKKQGEGTHPEPPLDGPLSTYVEGRTPKINGYPFEEWYDSIVDYLRSNRIPVEDGTPQAPYVNIANEGGVPRSFVVLALEREFDATPVRADGNEPSRVPTSWDDLSDKQQDTLLASAYFPEMGSPEIANLQFTSIESSGSVKQTIEKYGWMLAHPGVETPIGPTEGDERVEAPEAPTLGSSEPDTAEATDGGAEAQSQTTTESPPPEPAQETPEGVVISYDEAWDLITSRWERGDKEGARELFNRSLGLDDE